MHCSHKASTALHNSMLSSVVRTGLARAVTRKLKHVGGISLQSVRTLVQIQHKPHLAGSESPTFPKYLEEFRDDLPYNIQVPEVKRENLSAYGKELRPILDQRIEKYGAVLIKGLPLPSGEDFSEFFESLDLAPMDYVGGSSIRQQVTHKVSTASNEPPEYTIEPHNEMSYLPYWPQLLFLYCEIPAGAGCGGESGITDVRRVFKELDSEVKDRFIKKGLRYHRYLPDKSNTDYTSWQDSMMTENREEAERILKETNQQFKWEEDGALTFWVDRPAMAPHYRTGEMLWFNQAHSSNWTYFESHPVLGDRHRGQPENKYPFTTFYGDGTSIELDFLQHIREVSWRCTVGGQLQKSDVLILDNMLMQHSRLSFTGARKLLIALANYK